MGAPPPLAIVLVLVLDIEHGLGMQCRNNPELASMVLQTRWVKHFSRTRTTTRTRTTKTHRPPSSYLLGEHALAS